MKNKNLIKILLVAVAVVAAGVIYTLISSAAGSAEEPAVTDIYQDDQDEEDESLYSEVTARMDNDAEENSTQQVCVHVCGRVAKPGVYYLPEGARIHQAVEEAGGFTDEADQSVVNMASFVTDGMQVYIPGVEEAEREGLHPAASAAQEASDGLVNINTADEALLMTLPGIGQAKAAAIISYRNDNGTFHSIEDIQNVAGIKESSFSKFKDLIKV